MTVSAGHEPMPPAPDLAPESTPGALAAQLAGAARRASHALAAAPGKVIGPSFAADEVPDVIEAVVETYRRERRSGELFIDTSRRLGTAPFRAAANAVRRATAGAVATADNAA